MATAYRANKSLCLCKKNILEGLADSARKQAGKQAGRQAGKQAGRQAGRQASSQPSKQRCLEASPATSCAMPGEQMSEAEANWLSEGCQQVSQKVDAIV